MVYFFSIHSAKRNRRSRQVKKRLFVESSVRLVFVDIFKHNNFVNYVVRTTLLELRCSFTGGLIAPRLIRRIDHRR